MGMASTVDALVDRNDVIVYDSECHACIIDGVRMHQGKRFVFAHNDIEKLEVQLKRAEKLICNNWWRHLGHNRRCFWNGWRSRQAKRNCSIKKAV